MYLFNHDDVEPGNFGRPSTSCPIDDENPQLNEKDHEHVDDLWKNPEVDTSTFDRQGNLDTNSAVAAKTSKVRAIKRRQKKGTKSASKRCRPSKNATTGLGGQMVHKKACLIVSIDFGSTHSGASYRTNEDSARNQIVTLCDYPGNVGSSGQAQKIPSRIAYAAENEAWGPDERQLRSDVIGHEVKAGMKSYVCTKLLLDEDTGLTRHDDELLHSEVGASYMQLPSGKSAEKVTADFLRLFRKNIMQQLAREKGREFMNTITIHYVVTVPAIWSVAAIHRTLTAFKEAGFYSNPKSIVRTVSEPIAGALAALVGMQDKSPDLLDRIKTCIIVDGGGGTIDLEYLEIKCGKKLMVKELVAGKGGKCGSTTIDRQFLSLMQKKFGECFQAVEDSERSPASSFMARFEQEKRSFAGDLTCRYRIGFPALKERIETSQVKYEGYDLRNGEVILTGLEMAGLFNKTVNEICNLCDDLLVGLSEDNSKFPDAIIFVGGLATSTYIWAKIVEHFEQVHHSNIQILRPHEPWGAVSYGAAVYGFENAVKLSRVARRHYGIEAARAFREGIDVVTDAIECPLYGKRVKEMFYLIKKSEELKDYGRNHIKHWCGFLPLTSLMAKDLQFCWDVFCCDEDDAPSSVDDPSVRTFAKLNIDLTGWSAKYGSLQHPPISEDNPYKLPLQLYIQGAESGGHITIRANAERVELGRYVLNYTEE